MTAAISMAKELGIRKVAVPSAGNAAGALAAYAARAGMEAFIFMPADTPKANIIECRQTGANVTLVDGLITDCGKIIAERKDAEGWFDVSTLKEPYRVEGKKTMGYELAEQLDGVLPDVILYPTGGGTGLIGMWKAFDEMQQIGWIGPERPRMITVQSSGCAPIVQAFEKARGSPLNSRMRRPSPLACAFRKRSEIFSSSTPFGPPVAPRSRSATGNCWKRSARSAGRKAYSRRRKEPHVCPHCVNSSIKIR